MDKMIYAVISLWNDPDGLSLLSFPIKGIKDTALSSVVFEDIAAVVSDINKSDLITDKSNALAYAGVVEILAQQFPLLPMRYGSVMESNDSIAKMLERNYFEFQQNLLKVEGKMEYGLKIFCNSETLQAEIKAKSGIDAKTTLNGAPDIKNSVYRDYVNQKLKAHRFEEMMLAYVDAVINEITGNLKRLDAVSKIKKMTTPSNIIDAVFLLEKNKKSELIRSIEELQKQYPLMKFVLTGPWPPFNFVDLTVK
jgi:hypothetical protein